MAGVLTGAAIAVDGCLLAVTGELVSYFDNESLLNAAYLGILS